MGLGFRVWRVLEVLRFQGVGGSGLKVPGG